MRTCIANELERNEQIEKIAVAILAQAILAQAILAQVGSVAPPSVLGPLLGTAVCSWGATAIAPGRVLHAAGGLLLGGARSREGSCMPKVELELAGLKLAGVLEQEFLLLPVAAVLAAGGVLRPEPESPAGPQVAPAAPRPPPPPPPPPRRARLTPAPTPRAGPTRLAGRQALARAPDQPKPRAPGRQRGGKNWNRAKKKRAAGHP